MANIPLCREIYLPFNTGGNENVKSLRDFSHRVLHRPHKKTSYNRIARIVSWVWLTCQAQDSVNAVQNAGQIALNLFTCPLLSPAVHRGRPKIANPAVDRNPRVEA